MESSPDVQKGDSIPTTINTAYEMMKLGEQDGQKGDSIPTTINTAYEMMKLGEQDDPVYEVVDVPPETRPSLVKPDEVPSRSHLPLLDIPLPVAPPTGGEVGVAKEGGKRVCMITSQEISDHMTSNKD